MCPLSKKILPDSKRRNKLSRKKDLSQIRKVCGNFISTLKTPKWFLDCPVLYMCKQWLQCSHTHPVRVTFGAPIKNGMCMHVQYVPAHTYVWVRHVWVAGVIETEERPFLFLLKDGLKGTPPPQLGKNTLWVITTVLTKSAISILQYRKLCFIQYRH